MRTVRKNSVRFALFGTVAAALIVTTACSPDDAGASAPSSQPSATATDGGSGPDAKPSTGGPDAKPSDRPGDAQSGTDSPDATPSSGGGGGGGGEYDPCGPNEGEHLMQIYDVTPTEDGEFSTQADGGSLDCSSGKPRWKDDDSFAGGNLSRHAVVRVSTPFVDVPEGEYRTISAEQFWKVYRDRKAEGFGWRSDSADAPVFGVVEENSMAVKVEQRL